MGEASGLDKEAGARTTEAWNTTRAGHAAPWGCECWMKRPTVSSLFPGSHDSR